MNLASFHSILINSSAGKDSQAMLDHVWRMAVHQGVADRIIVVHCDLGESEWPGVVELAAEQARFYGVPFRIVRRHQDALLEHVRKRRKWPDAARRYCTSDHKREPIRKYIVQLERGIRMASPSGLEGVKVRILNCMGIRAQESPARAKKDPLAVNRRATSKRREVWDWLPIHNWTTDEVWRTIRLSRCPHHYAYDLGMPRLSCCFCVLAPKSALIVAARANPRLLDKYIEVEQAIGHTFKQGLSLVQIREAALSGEAVQVQDWRM